MKYDWNEFRKTIVYGSSGGLELGFTSLSSTSLFHSIFGRTIIFVDFNE